MPCPCCGGTSCCKKLVLPPECVANGYEFYSCDQVSDAECLSTSPTATRCTPNGNRPASSAPYFCMNETYKNGAWVKVENWTLGGSGVPATTQPGITAEAIMNATFFVENFNACSGPRIGKGFSFTVPTSTTGCLFSNWSVVISNLFICEESVTIQIDGGGPFCVTPIGLDFYGGNKQVPNPCGGNLCNCTSYGGANSSSDYFNGGDGTVQVYPA